LQRKHEGVPTVWSLGASRQCLGLCLALLVMSGRPLHSQDQRGRCFAIRVVANGRAVQGPDTITLATRSGDVTVLPKGRCFNAPDAVADESTVDVRFVVLNEQISISKVPTAFLKGPWDIELEDIRFPSSVALPKGARAKDVCAVSFHVSEPERTWVVGACRTPLSKGKPHD